MIERISLNSVNKDKNQKPQNQPQFKGSLLDGALAAVQMCEANPMLNVTVLDLSTAILPRTYIESKTNGYAGFEAFRRESSGLIVNCLIPSFIALGIAKLLEKPIMGGKTKMGSCWANEDTIKLVADYWKKAEGSTTNKYEEKVANTIKEMLKDIHGLDGDIDKGGLKSFADYKFDDSVKKLTNAVCNPTSQSQKEINEAYQAIVKETHISENIKFGKDAEFFSEGLKSVLRDTPKILKEFVDKGIHESSAVETFIKKSKNLINTKSLGGLAIIIPIAISMQPINRWITSKMSGKKGAPIYKDYKETQQKELTPHEKAGLFKQKLVSVGSMVGVALLSMMKIPTMKMFQFKGLFPSMDQARLISTATFSSRMMASENRDELREATVRDIATFSSFYFLGDYAAKAAASLIERIKPDVKLLNRLKPTKDSDNVFKKFGNWVKNTSLKSSDEVATPLAKRMRSVCQLSNIGFSLLLLGIIIPSYTRGKTDRKHEEEMKKMGIPDEIINKYYPPFAMNSTHSDSKRDVYQAFFTSK